MTKASEMFENMIKDFSEKILRYMSNSYPYAHWEYSAETDENFKDTIEYLRKVLKVFEIFLQDDRYPYIRGHYKGKANYVFDFDSNISYRHISRNEMKVLKYVIDKEKDGDRNFKSYKELLKCMENRYK